MAKQQPGMLSALLGIIILLSATYVSNAVGATGIFSTIILLAMFIVMVTWMGKGKLDTRQFVMFLLVGIIVAFTSGFIGTYAGVTDPLASNLLFFVALFGVLWWMGKRRIRLGR